MAVLNTNYEEEFLGFSYGFRPKRSQHDAQDALMVGIQRRRVNRILDVDYRSFFDTIGHDLLVRFLRHRIGDDLAPADEHLPPLCVRPPGAAVAQASRPWGGDRGALR